MHEVMDEGRKVEEELQLNDDGGTMDDERRPEMDGYRRRHGVGGRELS